MKYLNNNLASAIIFARNVPLSACINALIMLSLLAGLFVFNFSVDPYHLTSSTSATTEKRDAALESNQRLWKLAEFKRAPCPQVLIGDSRMRSLTEAMVSRLTSTPFYNFAYGGGTLADSIETFWFADRCCELKQVIIGVNFDSTNAGKQWNLVRPALNTLESPMQSYLSPVMTAASWRLLAGGGKSSERPPVNREVFWKAKIEEGNRNYQSYVYAEDLMRDLTKIADHCKSKQIQLQFVVFPSHQQYRDLVAQNHLNAEFDHFVQTLKSLSPTLDFDRNDELTRDEKNFRDPVHFNEEVGIKILRELLQK